MTQQQPNSTGWSIVVNANHLQLSAIDPPDARVPGPVIGPGSRVRPCNGRSSASDFGVICLDVDAGERIERGYTIKRMVALAPDSQPMSGRYSLAIATPVAVALLVALILAFA